MPSTSISPSLRSPRVPNAGWSFTLYPDAGEGGGCFVSANRPERSYVAKGAAADPERAAKEAGRRARAKLRRYCAANRLNRLGTLTYAGVGLHDPKQLPLDIAEFFRNLRECTGGKPFPYVWVPEWHKTNHGLHVHFAVGRYIRRNLISTAWGRGHVHIKLLGGLGVGSDNLAEARHAAGYLSKYVSKTFTDPGSRVFGLHRYDVAQGFQPHGMTLTGLSSAEVMAQASDYMGKPPGIEWSSASVEEWAGPPAVWAQWGA
ncbi:rolling circle replication-associated protein [Arthrobacter sp. Hz1]